MTRMQKSFALCLLACMLLGALSGCAGAPGAEPTRGEVVVYVGVPLSGFQANAGQTVLGGVRLAAAEANRSGGLNGYKVIVRGLDDESTDEVAVDNIQTIQDAIDNGERVLGVIGHLNSGQTSAAMELYSKMPLVVITPTASEPSISQHNYPNFFRANANDSVQAETLVRFLTQKLNARSVAVLYNDTSYGVTLAKEDEKPPERPGDKNRGRPAGQRRSIHLHQRSAQSAERRSGCRVLRRLRDRDPLPARSPGHQRS